jgi:hypothetical protein
VHASLYEGSSESFCTFMFSKKMEIGGVLWVGGGDIVGCHVTIREGKLQLV